MLRLPAFTYEPAHSIAQAVGLLTQYGPDALVVSGGTDLYANMKQRLFTPKVLVGLRSISEMRFIAYDDATGLDIGALTTLRTIAEDPIINARYHSLARAASLISTPQLRNMGTIGGNVCLDTRCNFYNQQEDWRQALGYCLKKDGDVCRVAVSSTKCLAVNSSDLVPVLQSFDATLHLAGPTGERAVTIAEFYRDDGRYARVNGPTEVVTRITIPPPQAQTRSAYRKLRLRGSFDFPLLGVAAVVRLDDDGICRDARLILNAVAAQPVEVTEAVRCLVGTRLEADALAAAAECAYKCGKPLDNTSASVLYRKRMLRVFARRTLEDLLH
ncbi:MAG: FAD binding domain-containing protein [Vulcanimicrobiaceae bacterium]